VELRGGNMLAESHFYFYKDALSRIHVRQELPF